MLQATLLFRGVGLLCAEVYRNYGCGHCPEGNAELVGVEEVVEEPVNVIGEQAERERQSKLVEGFVGCLAVGADTCDEGQSEDAEHEECPWYSLFGEWPDVLAVGVAQVAEVGTDGGTLVGLLIA